MYDLCMTDDTLTQTMAEALAGMADIDEQTAAFLVPQLAELLGREADMNMEQFGAQQEEIMELYLRITGLRQNAQGIRMILKMGDDE